ncbi:phosphoacetylglucosamine mutase-like, partial [Saccoglossus kowalevskii]
NVVQFMLKAQHDCMEQSPVYVYDEFNYSKAAKASTSNTKYQTEIHIDGANGIGALKVQQLLKYLNETITVTIYNDGSIRKLNDNCGADYVKLHQKPPNGLSAALQAKCISYDGDADRILYFYKEEEGQFRLLDGDKIAALIVGYIKKLLSDADLDLNLGAVQTAYTNGSSTQYLEDKMVK